MNIKRKFIALILSLVITVSTPLSIFAMGVNKITQEQLSELVASGETFTEVMALIQSNYVGKSVTNKGLLQAAIKGMASSLDEYSEFFTEEEYKAFMNGVNSSNYMVGVTYFLNKEGYPVVEQVVEDSPASKSYIAKGDVLKTFNGIDLKNKVLPDIVNEHVSKKIFDVKISGLRGNKEVNFDIKLEQVVLKSVVSKNISELIKLTNPRSDVAYIRITSFSSDTAKEFKSEMQAALAKNQKRLILDLRGNGGGLVDQATEIARMLVPAGPIIYIKNKDGQVLTEKSTLQKSPFDKIVVLTDGNTASSSEILASALKASGAAITVGRNTFGKGIAQSLVELNGLGAIKFTTYEFFDRNNKKIHGIGIAPDVKITALNYITEKDNINSDNVINVLSTLGYSSADRATSIGIIQQKHSLKVTKQLDEDTIKVINEMVYKYVLENDRELNEGYNQVIK